MFRNLTLFRFPASVAASLGDALENDLAQRRLRSCGPLEKCTAGFVSPFGDDSQELTHRSGEFVLIAVGWEERMLPASVINKAMAERVADVKAREGRLVGAKERKRLKDEVLAELLPRAFCRPVRVLAWLDTANGWLVVDTASRKRAEDVVAELREAIGRFPATPASPEESPRSMMTNWLIKGGAPDGFALGEECELRDPAEAGAIVRCRRQDLLSDELREHLQSGKQAFQLGLVFQDRLSFVLDERLALRKFHLLDVVLDKLGEDTFETRRAEIEAMFALAVREAARALAAIEEQFGIERPGER